jgi:hypothetical protein
MSDLNGKTVTVVDNGLFLPLALKLIEEAGTVNYYSPSEESFPTCKRLAIGDGFDGLNRVTSLWDVERDTDLWIFPDIGFSSLQLKLLADGRRVWGARNGDELELSLKIFLEALQTTTLPVPPHETVVGIDNLRAHLRNGQECYIKVSRLRGDWETFHWRSEAEDGLELDQRVVALGPFKDLVTFYVFDPIEASLEDGYDGFCVDGKWPSLCIHGIENKDRSYLGAFQNATDMPEQVAVVNEQFGPILSRYGYRGFFSSEVRITEAGESYFIDPTCRSGSPPSQVQCEMIGNLGDILWRGAQGECIDPEPVKQFGVQAALSVASTKEWSMLRVPLELAPWLKCGLCCRIDDALAFPDTARCDGMIGWLVAIGDTVEEAIEELNARKALLPDGVDCHFESLAKVLEDAAQAQDDGMQFGDRYTEIPEPEIIAEEA